ITYMALLFCAPPFTGNLNTLRRTTLSESPSPIIRCIAQAAPTRRTANYQPNLWTDNRIQSLTSSFVTVGLFKDGKGDLKAILQHETQGILSLYEASYVAKEGELVLDQAMDFTTKHLKCFMEEGSLEPRLREHVAHALELPLHWRMQRSHTRWFIEAYQREATMNPVVLELAKLDFNVVQGMYKGELRELSSKVVLHIRWWTNLGLAQKLSFFRDRLTENFLCTVGCAFEPQFWEYREIQTKANCLIAMLDDVYDIYGTLNELELFTEAIER
ncbi:hypothetical protein BHM03_00056380, partial [Ensete ventricosum]